MNLPLLALLLTTSLASLVLCRVGPDGYDTFPDSYHATSSYKIHLEDKTWEEANLICQDEGAHLIVINSLAEADSLNLLRDSQEKRQYHVGMHCKGRWGHWVTVLGGAVNESGYNNWLDGEPTPDEHCGNIQLPDKRYNNVRCNFAAIPFICEKPAGDVAVTSASAPRPAPCLSVGYQVSPNAAGPTSSYKIHYELKTWEQANLICHEEGGHLMVINSQAEADMLPQLRNNIGVYQDRIQFHVGMHCKGHWGHWVTVLGDAVNKSDYNKWLDGEPTPNEHCGNIQLPDKRYNNVKCNFALNSFICEKPVTDVIVTSASENTPALAVPCEPVGYKTFPNSTHPASSYKIHLEDKTWEEANLICQEEGAHLIVINSLAEADSLNLLRDSREKRQYHVGMHCKGRWGHWVTVLGRSVNKSDYNKWLDGEPTPDEHCGAMQLPDKRYNNVKCNFKFMPFICEKPAPVTVIPAP